MEKYYLLFLAIYLIAFQIGLTRASTIKEITEKISQDATELKKKIEKEVENLADDVKDPINEVAENIETATNEELETKLENDAEKEAVTDALEKFKKKVKEEKEKISKSKAEKKLKEKLEKDIDNFETKAENELKKAHPSTDAGSSESGSGTKVKDKELNAILAEAESKFKKAQQELNPKKKREEMKTKLEREIKNAANKEEEINKFRAQFHEYVQGGTEKMKEINNEALKKIEASLAVEDDIKKAKGQLETYKNAHQAQISMEIRTFNAELNAIALENGIQIPNANTNNVPPNQVPNNNNPPGRPPHPEFGTAEELEIFENENPRAKAPRMANCGDAWDPDHCEGQINLCKNRAYYRSMKRNCMQTCGHCIPTTFVCQDRYEPDCIMWGQAFCDSREYPKGTKIKQCARFCNLC